MVRSQIVALSLGAGFAAVIGGVLIWQGMPGVAPQAAHSVAPAPQAAAPAPTAAGSQAMSATNAPASESASAKAPPSVSPSVSPSASPSASPSPAADAAPSPAPGVSAKSSAEAAPKQAPAPAAVAASAAAVVPQFDTVRVEPSGEAVVAGHGPANGKVALLAGEKVIGDAQTEDSGDFVIVPERLAPGNYVLSLRSGAVRSSQSVTVSVPAKGNKKGLIVALNQPGKPSVLLADPTAPSEPAAKPATSGEPAPVVAAKAAPTVVFKTAEVDKGGFYASGLAPAGTHVRIYLNGSALADVIADSNGHWSLTIGKGMTAGHYVVRADAVDAAGKVVARAEVPFDMPVAVAENDATPHRKAADAAPAAAVASVPSPQPKAPAQAAEAKAPETEAPQPAVIAKSDGMAGQGVNAQEGAATSQTAKVAVATPKPVEMPPANPAETPPPVPDASHAMVAEVNTAKVVHGDSLWRISRETLGHGVRYTLIYQANAGQIRNPNLIYPGQVFVVPHVN